MINSTSWLKNSIPNLIFLLSFIYFSYSQDTQKMHLSDSLKKYTYDELYDKQDLYWNDTLKAKIYIRAYLNKAKNDNDTIKIANAYYDYGTISENYEYGIKYYDSVINLTREIKNFKYPGHGYMAKGMCNYIIGNYEKSLDNYLIAQDFAVKNNNIQQLLYLKQNIGDIKFYLGKNDESLMIFKSIYKQIGPTINKESINLQRLYLRSIFGISNSYIYSKDMDSAITYAKKGLVESLILKDSTWYFEFVNQTGVIAYYQNNFKNALDSINKSAPYATSQNGILNDYYYKANIYLKQHKQDKAFIHFKKADSIYNLTRDVVPEVRDIQEFFVNHYKKNGDVENQLKYINQLLYIDSIISHNRIHLNETISKEYDTPLLLSEKEQIIASLKNKERKSSLTIYILITLGIISVLFFIWHFRKQHILKVRFRRIILNKEVLTKSNIRTQKKELSGISEEIVISVLKALDVFEKNKYFIDNKLTLGSLSNSFNTNSSYLSKIINHYKKKNFSSYISDLRIDYCIEELKSSNNFKKYSIKAIANEIGFNNSESFSTAFFKKTGIYPSYFIKEMEKETLQK